MRSGEHEKTDRRKNIFEADILFVYFLMFVVLVWAPAAFSFPEVYGETKIRSLRKFFTLDALRLFGVGIAAFLFPVGLWLTAQVSRSAPPFWSRIFPLLALAASGEVVRYFPKIWRGLSRGKSPGVEAAFGFYGGIVLGALFIGLMLFWEKSSLVERFFLSDPRPDDAPRPYYTSERIGRFGKAILAAVVFGLLAGVAIWEYEVRSRRGAQSPDAAPAPEVNQVVEAPEPVILTPRVRQAFALPPAPNQTIAPQILDKVCPRRGDAYVCMTSKAGNLTIGEQSVPNWKISTDAAQADTEVHWQGYRIAFASGDQRIEVKLRPPPGELPYPGVYSFGPSKPDNPLLEIMLQTDPSIEAEPIETKRGGFILHDLDFDPYGRLIRLGASFEMIGSAFGDVVYGRICYRCDIAAWGRSASPSLATEVASPGIDLTLDVLDALCPETMPAPTSWCLLSESRDRRFDHGFRIGAIDPKTLTIETGPGGPKARGEWVSISIPKGAAVPAKKLLVIGAPLGETLQIGYAGEFERGHRRLEKHWMNDPAGNSGSIVSFEIFHLGRDEAGAINEIGVDYYRLEHRASTAGRICYGCDL